MGKIEPAVTRYRAIDHFSRQHPDMSIIQWKYVDASNPDIITVYTDTETLTVQYNPETGRSEIVAVNGDVPEAIKERVTVLHANDVANEATESKVGGRISGCIATVLTILYAIYILSYFGNVGMNSFSGYIAMQLVMPHLLCVAVAAVFSLIGFFGKKRWAVLTAGILMAVSAVLFMQYAPMVIIQSVLFFVSYARMGSK